MKERVRRLARTIDKGVVSSLACASRRAKLLSLLAMLFVTCILHAPVDAHTSLSSARYTLLIAGLDRDATSHDPNRQTDAHADALILLSSQLGSGVVDALHIPRDTRIYIPHSGYTKINGMYLLRHRTGLAEAVSNLTGIHVDDVLVLDFARFRQALHLVPGILFKVDRPMRAPEGDVALAPGTHVLSPTEALTVVRFRHEPLGDIGRVHRQERFMRSAVQLASRLPFGIFRRVMLTLDPQLSGRDIFLSYEMVHPLLQYHAHSVPGNFSTGQEVSYWLPDQRGMAVIAALILHKNLAEPAF